MYSQGVCGMVADRKKREKNLGVQGIGYPLLVSKWLIILVFSCRVTVM
jgi:hypothetical protein